MLLEYLAILAKPREPIPIGRRLAYIRWYSELKVLSYSFIAVRHLNAIIACPERYMVIGCLEDSIATTYIKLRASIELLDVLCLIDYGVYDEVMSSLKQACVLAGTCQRYPGNYKCKDGSVVYGL